jgi:hypothetical protein
VGERVGNRPADRRELRHPVTLRKLYYQLVARQLIPNNTSAYKTLSDRTATARRAGEFPGLTDNGRSIHRYQAWTSPRTALTETAECYRRDRTEGQELSLCLGVEKNGMVPQLMQWFGELGIPVLPLGGYSSETFECAVEEDTTRPYRPARWF